MISFALQCEHDHAFEAWFRNGEDFEQQKARQLVMCPVCGTYEVAKALMAPAVSTARGKKKMALAVSDTQKKALAKLQELSRHVRDNADYVGDKFAEEARKIHFGETSPRGIYGEATTDEAKTLLEDGVSIMPLPVLPEDHN